MDEEGEEEEDGLHMGDGEEGEDEIDGEDGHEEDLIELFDDHIEDQNDEGGD